MNEHSGREANGLPYRACVGIMLFNTDGLVWVGERLGGVERSRGVAAWQMPQGGIDAGEDPLAAAGRELYEETSVRSITIVAQSREWLTYELPAALLGRALRGKFRGQRQKWFLARFDGADSEVNVSSPGDGTEKPEFAAWKWVETEEIATLIVPFKREVYRSLIAEFGPQIRKCLDGKID